MGGVRLSGGVVLRSIKKTDDENMHGGQKKEKRDEHLRKEVEGGGQVKGSEGKTSVTNLGF